MKEKEQNAIDELLAVGDFISNVEIGLPEIIKTIMATAGCVGRFLA